MLCSFLLCSGSLVWKHAFFTEHPKGWHHFALLKEQSKGEGSAMREGSYSQSDTEEPAEVTPRRKDRFFIPISASYIASKGKGNGKIVSVKNVSSKVFLDRFPESANHKQQWGAHFQEDGAMTQTSIIKAWKKLFLPWIARHLQLPSI